MTNTEEQQFLNELEKKLWTSTLLLETNLRMKMLEQVKVLIDKCAVNENT